MSDDTVDRVSQPTLRAAATTREAQTPTVAQHRITAEYSKPSRALRNMYVGQTAASAFGLAALWKATKNVSEHQTMRLRPMTKQQSCNRHNTSIPVRDKWGSRASHGRTYLILGGAPPRRVPLESPGVRFCPGPQFYLSVVYPEIYTDQPWVAELRPRVFR